MYSNEIDPSQEALGKLLESLQGTPQALVLSAYMEEKKRWSISIKSIMDDRFANIQFTEELIIRKESLAAKLHVLAQSLYKESFASKLLFRWFKVEGKTRKRIHELNEDIRYIEEEIERREKLKRELENLYESELSNYPNMDRYELAMMENSLFKPR